MTPTVVSRQRFSMRWLLSEGGAAMMPRDAASHYLQRSLSVIPVGPDKRPLVPWAEYQRRQPTGQEVDTWWEQWPDANVGIVTASVSGGDAYALSGRPDLAGALLAAGPENQRPEAGEAYIILSP